MKNKHHQELDRLLHSAFQAEPRPLEPLSAAAEEAVLAAFRSRPSPAEVSEPWAFELFRPALAMASLIALLSAGMNMHRVELWTVPSLGAPDIAQILKS